MADLGNLMFRMGLNAKDFEKQMADELALAKRTAEEIKKAFADIKLPTAGGGKGSGGKGKGGSGAGAGGFDNDELKITDDLYKKLANRIGLVGQQMAKLRINAKFGYDGQYVRDAIDKLKNFKSQLQTALNSGSRSEAKEAMKLFSNQDYALLSKQVGNLISQGDKYARSLDLQAAAQRKALEQQERSKVTAGSLVGQYYKLADAINKVNFAQSHTNKSGVSAAGSLTNSSLASLRAAQQQVVGLVNTINSGGSVPRSQVSAAYEAATRAIRESSTAIQQQRAINTEAQRQQIQGQAQILARQRAINAAQAENARLIARSNSHFSIMRNLVGQVGSMMGMYFSVFALQNFVQDLVRIRGEFDMQYTSLKAILQSGQQASELFNQLKSLAPISPYQFKDLATYAKQLSAYSIPYNELFDTTKRLADLSSGLGVDFNRIVLAYGQVRSAAVLRGQELRQFTEAGIPMVDELAKKFTKLRGEVVTTGDVFGLISERQVPFEMVKEVIDDLTNEGGKFYMMQEKQSETLKGKVSNLADRYDIMMNSLGEANDGVLKGTVDALASIMEHADLLVKAIKTLAIVWGLWKINAVAQTAVMGKNLSAMTAEEAKSRTKQANLLREAQLYRTLTAEEQKAMAARGVRSGMLGGLWGNKKLSSSELGSLALNDRINKDQILRLAYMGKINQGTMKELVIKGKVTAEEAKSIANQRLRLAIQMRHIPLIGKLLASEKMVNGVLTARIALYRLMGSVMRGIGAIINPTTLAIAGITAIFTAIADNNAKAEKRAENAKAIADNAAETYDDLAEYLTENPLKITVDAELDSEMLREQLNNDIKKIEEDIPQPITNGLIASIYTATDENGEVTLKSQAERAHKILEAAEEAQLVTTELKSDLEEAAKVAGAGLLNESLLENIKDFATQFNEFKNTVNGLKRSDIQNALKDSGLLDLKETKEDAQRLSEMLSDSSVSMRKIYNAAVQMYDKYNTANYDGKVHEKNNDFFLSSGFESAHDEEYGSTFIKGFRDAFDTMDEQVDKAADDLKTRLSNKGVDITSEVGKIAYANLKKSFIEDNEISDADTQKVFGFLLDEKVIGGEAAAFNMLGDTLGGKLSEGAMQAVKKFKEDGVWTDEMEAAVEEAKDKLLSEQPSLKDDLVKWWNVSPLELVAHVRAIMNAQEMEEWKKELIDHLGDKYEVAIKMAANPKEAQDNIQKAYDDARAFITKQKPLLLKLGLSLNTGADGIKKWLDDNPNASFIQRAIMKYVYKAFQTVEDGKWGKDNGIIDPTKSDNKDKPKNTNKNKKDKYTEDLKRRYESFKKAIQEYNKAIKSMGEAKAKALVKTVYGIELPDRYIDKYGGIALAEDFEKKNTKKTDAAKNFRETLRNDKTAATVQKSTDSYDALAEAQMENIKLTEKQYKAYDDLFNKTGDAKLASIMAFGTETKPYKDVVEYLKAELAKMGNTLKTKNVSFGELLNLSPQDIENLPAKIQELFKEVQEAVANGGEDFKKGMEEVFSKTDDEDVKIALNNSLRENLISQIPEQMKSASPEAQANAAKVIRDYYNKLNQELNLEKIKKSLNWEQLFGNLAEMSEPMLARLEKMLQKIVDTNKDLDPQKMKEWVEQLNKVKEARSGINSVFDVIKSIPKRNLANRKLTQTNKEVDRVNSLEIKGQQLAEAYDNAIVAADTKTQKEIEQTKVIVQLIDAQGNLQESTMTYSDLLKRQSSDQNTSQALQNAADKASSSFFQGAAATLFSKIGVKGASAGASGAGTGASGGSGGASSIAIVDAIIQVVHQNLSNMSDFIKALDKDKDETTKTGRWANNLETYDSYVYGGWEKLKQGNVLGAISDTINGWGAGIDVWKSDTEAIYQIEKERYNNLLAVWDKVIDRIKEALDDSSTEDVRKTAERMKEVYQNEIESAKTMGLMYLNSGAKSWKHSHGASQRIKMSDEGWKQFYEWAIKYNIDQETIASIATGRMTGLFDLSVDQLKALQEDAPTFYASLHDDTRSYLEQIIESTEALDDLNERLNEVYTSTTADEIADSFASALDSMDDQTRTFADNFTKTLRTAVINAFLNSAAMKSKIEAWYKKLAEFMSDGILTAGEKSILKNGTWTYTDDNGDKQTGYGYDYISKDVSAEQAVLKELGLYDDQSAGSLTGGIKSITEETADLLASYVNAIRADVAFIRTWYVAHFDDNNGSSDTITTISLAVANIEANTRRSADNTDELVDLLTAVTKTTQNGRALRVS